MNILHHKSWHVYNLENKEKVQKDVDEHNKTQTELEERNLKAEQEYRLNILRKRAQAKKLGLTSPSIDDIEINDIPSLDKIVKSKPQKKNINLFEQEKSEKVDNKRKEMDHNNYLDPPSKRILPWYAKSVNNSKYGSNNDKVKTRLDPMKDFKQKNTAKENKHKKDQSWSKLKGMDKLRAEKKSRENDERARVAKLLNANQAGNSGNTGYSDQYNPQYARDHQFNDNKYKRR